MILDGKALSKRIRQELKAQVADFTERSGIVPCLATILVGDDPASAVYVRNKRRACDRIGFLSRHIPLPKESSQGDLLALVAELNEDPSVHGILVQLPLPTQIDEQTVISSIVAEKDVDGFHVENVGLLALKKPRFISCTPYGIMRLLEESGIDPKGKKATVVGRSGNVGLPAALLLLHADATVTVVHSRTEPSDFEAAIRAADILVVAIGRAEFIPGRWVKEGSVVIDVGINRLPPAEGQEKGRLVGDVEFAPALERAAAITPVPGGVGPMTIAMLMVNTFQAAQEQAAAR